MLEEETERTTNEGTEEGISVSTFQDYATC